MCIMLRLTSRPGEFMGDILVTFQINKAFRKVIMQNNVTGCVIIISNKIEYLDK